MCSHEQTRLLKSDIIGRGGNSIACTEAWCSADIELLNRSYISSVSYNAASALAPTNTPFDAEPIPTGVLHHLAARGREMRACTATTLSVRYRDPVIRPSMDSMIFRKDFEKKPHQQTTPTTPGELCNCTLFTAVGYNAARFVDRWK